MNFRFKFIVLIGNPGSGKSFIASKLKQQFGYHEISFGSLLREKLKNTQDPDIACINLGHQIDSKLACNILYEEMQKLQDIHGLVIEGFPRDLMQCKFLTELLNIEETLFVHLQVDMEKSLARIMQRKICEKCGGLFDAHCLSSDCDSVGVLRKDDSMEITKFRYQTQQVNLSSILDYIKQLEYTVKHVETSNMTKLQVYKEIKDFII